MTLMASEEVMNDPCGELEGTAVVWFDALAAQSLSFGVRTP
jgi:hypothetical protein